MMEDYPLRSGFNGNASAKVALAVRKVLTDWDGRDWDVVRNCLEKCTHSSTPYDMWTMEDVYQRFAIGQNKFRIKLAVAAIPYWYHRINLGNGIVTPGWSPLEPEKYGIPECMAGESVLDVGAWDGYWTFEAVKRGASRVLAIDDFSDTCGRLVNADRSKQWANFDLCRQALGISEDVAIRRTDSIERHACVYGICDRVFLFGVLYHLKNPILALSNCFQSLRPGGTIHVETAILDGTRSTYTGQPCNPLGCYAEFFPNDEFGRNSSNWWVPTLRCAAAWLEAVGFIEIESWKLRENPATLAECRGFLRAKKPT